MMPLMQINQGNKRKLVAELRFLIIVRADLNLVAVVKKCLNWFFICPFHKYI
jgi:hypothetical protein